MSFNLAALLQAPIIEFNTIDSTNNYAMQLADADKALPGLTIVAGEQTAGKGQRGKVWLDRPGECLLMSVITVPVRSLSEQFVFNASIAVGITEALNKLYENWSVYIKWPNDIIINDKKAGGVLIENILRGSQWLFSIVGLGLNVKQMSFDAELPYATSLKITSGQDFDLVFVRDLLRANILDYSGRGIGGPEVMELYNGYLYKKNNIQDFMVNGELVQVKVLQANTDGSLQVQRTDGSITDFVHGREIWHWE